MLLSGCSCARCFFLSPAVVCLLAACKITRARRKIVAPGRVSAWNQHPQSTSKRSFFRCFSRFSRNSTSPLGWILWLIHPVTPATSLSPPGHQAPRPSGLQAPKPPGPQAPRAPSPRGTAGHPRDNPHPARTGPPPQWHKQRILLPFVVSLLFR